MAVLARQVQGAIYYSKFDDLAGWSWESTWNPSWYPSLNLSGGAFWSSQYCLNGYTYPDGGGVPEGQYFRRYRTVTIPAGITTVRMQVHHRLSFLLGWTPNTRKQILLGSQVFLYYPDKEEDNNIWYFQNAAVSTSPGAQTLKVGVYAGAGEGEDHYHQTHNRYFDDLIIARSGNILVKGLTTGWKAKLYDASDALIAEATESGGTATLDVSAQAYPIAGRVKIYNGADVLQCTGTLSTDIFGGDEYVYGSGIYPLTVATDYFKINRTGMASPTAASLVFNLKDNLGNPVVGATVNFTTTHGDLGAASDTTDANGDAHTSLSAATVGTAIVKGVYDGDPPNGISRVFNVIEVKVIAGPTVPVITGYDVWIQGNHISKLLSVRLYSSEDMVEVEVPEIRTDLQYGDEIIIYQDSTLIFTGKIEVIRKALKPEDVTVVSGRSYIQHLMKIYIESATYTNKTLKAILDAIFTTYVNPLKQVSLGTIPPFLDNISATIEANETTAYDLLTMVANLGGLNVTVDENRVLRLR